jgi:hypothetical protein
VVSTYGSEVVILEFYKIASLNLPKTCLFRSKFVLARVHCEYGLNESGLAS